MPNCPISMLIAVENCCRIELAESADEARAYDGSLSMTVTSPANAGSPSKKLAIALPTAPPPMITTFLPAMTCRPCIPR